MQASLVQETRHLESRPPLPSVATGKSHYVMCYSRFPHQNIEIIKMPRHEKAMNYVEVFRNTYMCIWLSAQHLSEYQL